VLLILNGIAIDVHPRFKSHERHFNIQCW